MKLSLSSDATSKYREMGVSLLDSLKAIRECGFPCTDLDIPAQYVLNDPKGEGSRMREMLDSISLLPTTSHANSPNPSKHPEEAKRIANETLLFCQSASIPMTVVHPGAVRGNTREEFFEKNVAFYRSLIPMAEKTGVQVLVENIGNYADPYFLRNGAELSEMLDRIDHPLFGACWDIGHANHFYPKDGNPYDSILALGKRLKAIHAHDNAGCITDTYKHIRIDMHTFPAFSGAASVNWDAVLQGLIDVGYTGTFNFEVNAPSVADREPFIHQGKEVNRLAIMPMRVWRAFNTALYEMGKAMLEEYDLCEE